MSRNDHDNEEPTQAATLVDDWESLPETTSEWQPGQRLGPFVLKRKLGAGGMGMVWLAEQMAPLRREVALKVMLPERRSRLAEAHFEVERQALAQLSHRAVAHIHEAGELPDGGLFFAMEYVPGLPLDRYIEKHPPTLRQLVAMMAEICGGIQHAHQHGLIHRDIKPANILVGQLDHQPQPKIIDFGIAVESAEDDQAAGQGHYYAGTVAYMAPEQRNRNGGRIDVRADVFALGAVLAKCLLIHAGVKWRGGQRFDSGTVYAALCRHSGNGHTHEDHAQPEWARSLGALPADLRAIAVRAMAPEREDRYQSATALAEDLQRWLNSEPVIAMGQSRRYRLRCFLRRNALASTAAALIGLALIGGTVAALYGLTEAREGRSQAESALTLAEQRRLEAEELIQFMLGDFAEQLRPIGRLDLLDSIGGEALRYLTAQGAGDDPRSALSRARALRTLGEVQSRRNQFDAASETLSQAAELLRPWQDERDPELAELHFESGQIAFWRGFITYQQRDYETTESHWQRYMRDAHLFAELTDDHRRGLREMAYANNNLGTLAEASNQLEGAREHFSQSVEVARQLLLPGDMESVFSLANAHSWMARVESALGNSAEAWSHASQALELVVAQHTDAPDHARRRRLEINFRFILAHQARWLGLNSQAANHLRAALPLAESEVQNEPGQPQTQMQLARIAFLLARTPGVDEAEARAALERGEKAFIAAESLGLGQQRALELPALRQLAQLHHGHSHEPPIEEQITELLDALEQREAFDSTFFNLVEIVTEAFERLTEAGKPLDEDWLRRLQNRLDAIPETQRQSLRFKLAQRSVWQLQGKESSQREALEQMIVQARRSVIDHN